PADLVDMADRAVRQPVNADMDVLRRFLAAGNIEVPPARRAAADKDRVVALGEQRLHAVDGAAADKFDAEVEDVAAFLVDHRIGQAEFRDLRTHHAAGLRVLVEDDAFIAERREIARDRQRGGAAADERDALAVLLIGTLWKQRAHITLVVGGDALQAADRDRVRLDAATPTGRLAGPIAGTAEDSGKDVRSPVDHVSVGVTPGGNQA